MDTETDKKHSWKIVRPIAITKRKDSKKMNSRLGEKKTRNTRRDGKYVQWGKKKVNKKCCGGQKGRNGRITCRPTNE